MPSKRSSPAVKYSELLNAFELISAAPQYTNNAYICKDSGKIYIALADSDEDEDELPEYFKQILKVAPNAMMVNYLSDINLGGYFGGAFVFNNGKIISRKVLGEAGLLISNV